MLASDLLKLATALKAGTMSASDFDKLASAITGMGLNSFALSAEINFATAAGVGVIVPPTAIKLSSGGGGVILLTAKDGTVTVAPTLQIGTNAAINDLNGSQTPAGFTTQAVDTRIVLTTPSPVGANLSLATNGIRYNVTAGATLGTATVLRGRILMASLSLASY